MILVVFFLFLSRDVSDIIGGITAFHHKTRQPQRHHIACLRSAAAFSIFNPTCCTLQHCNQLPQPDRSVFLFCVWVFSSRCSLHYNIVFAKTNWTSLGMVYQRINCPWLIQCDDIYLIMVPFLWAHLITPVKDRANTLCVWELQLQQSYALDVMCMQPCVFDQYGEFRAACSVCGEDKELGAESCERTKILFIESLYTDDNETLSRLSLS